MGKPEVSIDVDPETGVWSTDGLPMIYMPRHFFVNTHQSIETALGTETYAHQLYESGFQSAYTWCESEAQTHQLHSLDIFYHYMKRLSQRGWGQFQVLDLDAPSGRATIRVDQSVFVLHNSPELNRKLCYMFTGWFPGALAWVGQALGHSYTLDAREIQCCAEGQGRDYCRFEVWPRG